MIASRSDFTYILTTNSLTLFYRGMGKTILSGDPLFKVLEQAVKEERWDDLPSVLLPERDLKVYSNGTFRIEFGHIEMFFNGEWVELELGVQSLISRAVREFWPWERLAKQLASDYPNSLAAKLNELN